MSRAVSILNCSPMCKALKGRDVPSEGPQRGHSGVYSGFHEAPMRSGGCAPIIFTLSCPPSSPLTVCQGLVEEEGVARVATALGVRVEN